MGTYVVFEEGEDKSMNTVKRGIYINKLIFQLRRDILCDDTHLDGSSSVDLHLDLFSKLVLIVQLF